ncbi:ABC transporter permease [Bacillus sp. FJAT-42376]|uniref:ABC transporter permease n=1 Tax=Bacillus sp. FJAT-42376 TaxID=2014076 RepID=UPI000F4E829C|nr:ABC transporter permease [Bacillus sp. FJAT-42376]AZB42245.1 ABC transporter permease [Bacillus sp. FJAT-42376]
MKNVLELWGARLEEHIKEVRSYLRYMLNDHLLIVMIFLLAGGALGYQSWLKELPDSFPAEILIAAVFALILIFSSVRTLFKEADLVFLLPLEEKMHTYLKKAKGYSFIQSLIPLILLYLLLGPLYLAVSVSGTPYIYTGVLLLVLNFWNMESDWFISYSDDASSAIWDRIVRFALNAAVLYFVLTEHYLFAVIVIVLMLGLMIYYAKAAKGKGLKWDRLIRTELRKKQSFYRLANLFTDVPKLKKEAHRRAYLDWVLQSIRYGREHVYMYMFARAFIRSTDYLGIFIRLTVISGLVLGFADMSLWAAVLVTAGTIFLTGIQLIVLVRHFDMLSIPDLYPVHPETKLKSFLTLLRNILFVQGLILGAVLLVKMEWIQGAASIGGAIVFVLIFVSGYAKKRIEKMYRG